MACRQTIYAQRLKRELMELLGGKCELCSEDDPDKLEFDHVNGRDYVVSELSFSARLARYRREAEAKELRLLCGACNLGQRKKDDNGHRFVATAARIERTDKMPF
jgi:5-methylcytosine-specific restriction endonuclease McrA